jgi:nicotinamidase-related amidase
MHEPSSRRTPVALVSIAWKNPGEMTARHPNVLSQSEAFLVVVDIQERFRTARENFGSMVENSARLVKTFRILGLPVFVTEQYPKGLGATVKELREALGDTEIHEKTCFSSCGNEELVGRVKELGRTQALVCGIEAHVCVNQSVHDLLQRGLSVHVAVDAVDSRRSLDREIALEKMQRSGAILTTAETAAFEILADARNPKFKEVQALFK